MANQKILSKIGLTNFLHSDVEIMSRKVVRIYQIYCSSRVCGVNSRSRKGILVSQNDFLLKECPHCNSSNYLYHDSIRKREVK